jgi:hypothetical protein
MRKELNGNPLSWLLEPENPSVRYWTLVDILERPGSDAELQASRDAISLQPLTQELFSLQHVEGYWGRMKPNRTLLRTIQTNCATSGKYAA